MSIDELIAKLEMAPEGSRELGDEILLATGWRRGSVGYWLGPIIMWSKDDRSYDDGKQPNPTTSLDAAIMLVPKGWIVADLRQWIWKDTGLYWACALTQIDRSPGNYVSIGQPSVAERCRPSNAALAMCIVALRAHKEMLGLVPNKADAGAP